MSTQQPNIDTLIDCYRAGMDTQEAASIANISVRTVNEMRSSPRNDIHRATGSRIEQAIAEYARETLTAISASHAKDWRAAAWTMEHVPAFRERYGQRAEQDASASAAAVVTTLAGLIAQRTQQPALPPADEAGEPGRPASERVIDAPASAYTCVRPRGGGTP